MGGIGSNRWDVTGQAVSRTLGARKLAYSRCNLYQGKTLILATSLTDDAVWSRPVACHPLVRLLALLAGAVGLLALMGWFVDLPQLRSVIPGAVEMKLNTALGIVAASVALWLVPRSESGSGRARQVVLSLSILLILLGAATLAEYAWGVDLGIDQALVRDNASAYNLAKGRMSPYSAVTFCAIGFAIGLLTVRRLLAAARVAAWLVVSIGALSILGYLWNAAEIVTDLVAPPVAVNTALVFVMLGSALWLCTLPERSRAPRTRRRLEVMLLLGFVPTAMLVILGGGLTYEFGASFSRAAERIAQAQAARGDLGRLRAAIARAESARTMAVVTGEAGYVARFEAEVRDTRSLLQALGERNRDERGQASAYRELSDRVGRSLRELAESIELGAGSDRDLVPRSWRRRRPCRRRTARSSRWTAREERLLDARSERADRQRGRHARIAAGHPARHGGRLSRALPHGPPGDARTRRGRRRPRAAQQPPRAARRFAHRSAVAPAGLPATRHRPGPQHDLREGRTGPLRARQPDARRRVRHDDRRAGRQDRPRLQPRHRGGRAVPARRPAGARDPARADHPRGDRPVTGRLRSLRDDGQATDPQPGRQPDHLLGVSHDITERKKAELVVRGFAKDLERRVAERTQQLAESNSELKAARLQSDAASLAKSSFLANMSHEIRTPLNAIVGLTHLLGTEIADPAHRDRLDKVAGAADHLLGVVNDILDLSKIEAGKLELSAVDFSLDALLAQAVSLVADTAREKGLEVVVESDAIPRLLHGDVTRLLQAIVNLLGNAVKFTRRGSVTLSASLADADTSSMLVRFAVARHRYRHRAGTPRRFVHALRAGRQLDDASLRRHRPGPVDHP